MSLSPPACRLGDYCSGHTSYPPRPNIQASHNVFVNSRGWHRENDLWAVHCNDDDCHKSRLAKGSDTVYVNSRQAGRVGDPVACGSCVARGSNNVRCGNGTN